MRSWLRTRCVACYVMPFSIVSTLIVLTKQVNLTCLSPSSMATYAHSTVPLPSRPRVRVANRLVASFWDSCSAKYTKMWLSPEFNDFMNVTVRKRYKKRMLILFLNQAINTIFQCLNVLKYFSNLLQKPRSDPTVAASVCACTACLCLSFWLSGLSYLYFWAVNLPVSII